MIQFSCPHCGNPIAAARHHAGKRGKCQRCGQVLRIPLVTPEAPVELVGKPIGPPPHPRPAPAPRPAPPPKPSRPAPVAAAPAGQAPAASTPAAAPAGPGLIARTAARLASWRGIDRSVVFLAGAGALALVVAAVAVFVVVSLLSRPQRDGQGEGADAPSPTASPSPAVAPKAPPAPPPPRVTRFPPAVPSDRASAIELTVRHDAAAGVYTVQTGLSRLRGTVDGKAVSDAEYPLEMSVVVQVADKAAGDKPPEFFLALRADSSNRLLAGFSERGRIRIELPGRHQDISVGRYKGQEGSPNRWTEVALFPLAPELFRQLVESPKVEGTAARCRFRLTPAQLGLLDDVARTVGLR